MARSEGNRPRHRAVPQPSRIRKRLSRGVMTLVSVVALLMTGAGYWVAHGALGGITISQALTPEDPRSSGNNMNILLIGLDSRKDQEGNDLPWSVLKQLHAGDSDDGGYNTNTLILVHVGADGKVVAFSIPRDDWVPFTGVPGYNHIKIKEAYGLTKQYVAEQLANQGVSDRKELETRGREAARAATLRAVRSLTGVPIDYFAEINLAGFYDLAQTLGGVDVCLNHAVYDSYSGADFPAGRQRLNAAQALAFVRQRHGLDNGDLDRTHRQQAFLSSVMRELQDSGTFTNLDRLDNLMAVARKDVVLSAGWDEDLFRRMGDLAGGNVEFRTLPVVRYDNIDGQDVNIIDPTAIRAEVAAALLGFPLLLVVGVSLAYLYVVLLFAPVLIVLERLPIVEAITRSFALVRHGFWRVLGIRLLTVLVVGVVGNAIAAPFMIVGEIVTAVTASDGSVTMRLVGATLSAIGVTIGQIVTAPFSAGVVVLLYTDRRIRAEAFDLVLQTGLEAGPAGGPAPVESTDNLWLTRPF